MDHLVQHIESLIFTADSPIAFTEIRNCLQTSFDTKFKKPALIKIINQLKEKYQQEEFSFELVEIGGGYQFLTKAAFHNTVGIYLKQTTKKRLSKAALETLSIIAYKQPVTKSEMEKIRGVSCDYSVQKLLEKELVAILGRADGPGKPLLYGTSEKFMDYFGLKDIDALPQPKDFREPDSEIGEKAPIDEDAPNSEDTPAIEASIPAPPQGASQELLQELPSVDDLGAIDTQEDIPQASDAPIPKVTEESTETPDPINEEQEDSPTAETEWEEIIEPDALDEEQKKAQFDSIEGQVYIPQSPDNIDPKVTEITEPSETSDATQEDSPIATKTAQKETVESETGAQEKTPTTETIPPAPTSLEPPEANPLDESQNAPTPTEGDLDYIKSGVISILAPPLTIEPSVKPVEKDSTTTPPSSTTPTSSLKEDIKEIIQVITALPLNDDLLNLINKKGKEGTSKSEVVGDANSDE